MKSSKMTLFADIFLKICLILALVVGGATRQEYSYYSFLRWFVMVSYIYLSYRVYGRKQFGLLIFFVAIAVIFNSFHKVTFQRDTWHLIDYIVAGFTALTIILDLLILVKKSPVG
jgi:hypothetical protein